jgi:hypothetical protein
MMSRMRETVSSQAPAEVARASGRGPARWLRRSALAGALAWAAVLLPPWPFTEHILWIERIVILGPLVIAPLALLLAGVGLRPGPAARCHALAARCQPLGASLALIALYPRPGLLAGALAGGWLLVTGLFALCGLTRLFTRGLAPIQELAIDAGLLYLPGGDVWLVASRLGVPFLGFSEPWVMLTAAHFHYAGLAAPVIAGAVGRALHASTSSLGRGWLRAYEIAAAGVMAGPPLVAAGIALWPAVEVASAAVLSLALLLLTAVALRGVVPGMRPRRAGALLAVAVSSLLLSMSCACAYAVGAFLEIDILLLPTMVWVHGLVNAIGFGAGGLIAFAMATPDDATWGQT